MPVVNSTLPAASSHSTTGAVENMPVVNSTLPAASSHSTTGAVENMPVVNSILPAASSHSTTGAVENMPVGAVPINLEQLLRVISFNRMATPSLKLVQVYFRSYY